MRAIGKQTFGTVTSPNVEIGDPSSAPASSPSGFGALYVKDGELKFRDTPGTEHTAQLSS
ncbi:MAG: hypothetical protein U0414_08725 [Polyangiaceae bacterium]